MEHGAEILFSPTDLFGYYNFPNDGRRADPWQTSCLSLVVLGRVIDMLSSPWRNLHDKSTFLGSAVNGVTALARNLFRWEMQLQPLLCG
jgi:hypothetical protein